ncbi:hypothetical protein SPRG_20746 [Saprolegnia parasitica CBS 223.65]|uniref:LRRNT domain-containing protein n=1 Tax=Saprolegnia parasitica (strain CBS 223.65) TaxID=695850 RepID=A0A067CEY9_SAPPC|nr:hypothetical protein SPRG_20746 [Saprolegnia parasitica CBS 223.65]KDO25111.1 hypothetical protein SPRG_20746 [Saprolegnia parasitica CBS 223.65]|eukprot:XP_012204235.1 hypothetical protein SPRG_20746 [Saprolegnia parasitica CBS 223.65]
MRWTSLVLILLALVERALGGCAYADLNLPANASILVADASCTSGPVCGVGPDCMVYDSFQSDWNSYLRFNAIGDLSGYTQPNLSVANASFLTLAKIKAPPTLTSLTLTNISRVHLRGIQATQWSPLTDLLFYNASIMLTNNIQWPPSLRLAMFRDIDLNNIPQGLPSTVQELAVQGNKLVDLTYLPENLTFLYEASGILA